MEPDQPVTRLADLDVQIIRTPDGMRVLLSKPGCGLRLLLLDPREAASLGGLLVAKSAKAGHLSSRDPGS